MPNPYGNPYQNARQGLNQRFQAQGQQTNDAIKRKFAAMGAGNSGAAIGAISQAAEQLAGQRESAANQIDQQEAGQIFQSNEAQKQRDYEMPARDRQLALAEKTQAGQMALAQDEAQRAREEQDFNIAKSLKDSGFNYNLSAAISPRLLAQFGVTQPELVKQLIGEGYKSADAARTSYANEEAARNAYIRSRVYGG